MKGSLPAARQAQTLNAVVATLSQCLDLDTGTLIPELRQAEEIRLRNAPAVTDADDQAAAELAVEEMDEEEEAPKHKRNGKAAKVDNDFSDLLPVSGISDIVLDMLLFLVIHTESYSPLWPDKFEHSKSHSSERLRTLFHCQLHLVGAQMINWQGWYISWYQLIAHTVR